MMRNTIFFAIGVCLFTASPAIADEVVASAAGGWFAVDARMVKDTTWEGGAIVGGETNLPLQSSPNAWGEVGDGSCATITWESTSGNSGTVAEATTAETVVWTPEPQFGTNTLTYVCGSVMKSARFVVVTKASGSTTTTPVPVPVSWIEEYYPGTLDYEARAKQSAANGANVVWETYVAGLDPTNAESVFTAYILLSNGVSYVSWTPDLNADGPKRLYRILGKRDLSDNKEDWEPVGGGHRFYKITVEMPDGETESDEPGPIPVNDVLPADATGMPIGITGDVLVIDVSAGSESASYPTAELTGVDIGTFNCDVYKTDKIVLRKIPAGTYYCQPGADSSTTVLQQLTTKGFYIGVFPVSQRQYERVMGTNPSYFKTDTESNVAAQRPVEMVSWNRIRGGVAAGSAIMASSADSFLKRLVAKTGLSGFDLPTEAQWEMACRAGATAAYGAYWDGTSAVELTWSTISEAAWYYPKIGSRTTIISHGGEMRRSEAEGRSPKAIARFARAEGVGLPEREARTRRAARGRATRKRPRGAEFSDRINPKIGSRTTIISHGDTETRSFSTGLTGFTGFVSAVA